MMPARDTVSRRRFVQATAALSAVPFLGQSTWAKSNGSSRLPLETTDVSLQGRIFKTLKIGMVDVPGSLTDKFKAVKAAGFDGIEMDSPGMDVEETKQAIADSGLPVDGTVNSTHWDLHHTSPDADVRKRAHESLIGAIRDTHAVGGNSVLLVAGHGNDGPLDEIYPRAVENIAKAIPVAAEKGIHILIENVWNHFLYDHDGDHTQTAEHYVKFIDDLNSPWVGMQFDIGNHWKFGSMGDWIRQFGHRIVKLDLKGFSRAIDAEKGGYNGFTKITEGDLDWADVRSALKEINYYGWAAAEVDKGGAERLREISANLDNALGLS